VTSFAIMRRGKRGSSFVIKNDSHPMRDAYNRILNRHSSLGHSSLGPQQRAKKQDYIDLASAMIKTREQYPIEREEGGELTNEENLVCVRTVCKEVYFLTNINVIPRTLTRRYNLGPDMEENRRYKFSRVMLNVESSWPGCV